MLRASNTSQITNPISEVKKRSAVEMAIRSKHRQQSRTIIASLKVLTRLMDKTSKTHIGWSSRFPWNSNRVKICTSRL